MHAPTIMPGWLELGKGVLREATLNKQLRELAILRVGYLSGSSYEVHQHRKLAILVGLSDQKITAIEIGSHDPAFDEIERLVIQFTEEVVLKVKSGDATFALMTTHFDHQEIVELLVTIGLYMSAARIMENLEIEIEDGGGPTLDEIRRLRPESIAPDAATSG
jgi:4-carboxymuconolactone decarboxylase